MRLLVHVPARSGSKGVPGKNLRTVGGLSLVAHAVFLGRELLRRLGDGLVVVDTDGEDIAAEARRCGAAVPFLRPAELANDTATTIDVALACLDRLASGGMVFDAVVLLQPTSPLRAIEDALACVSAFETSGSALTVTALSHPIERALTMAGDGSLRAVASLQDALAPRQALLPAVEPNGAVYVCSTSFLRSQKSFFVPGQTRGVLMPRSRSVDIDTPEDFDLAELFLAQRPIVPLPMGARFIGPGHPCFVIAEAGVNHNGDVALAHRLVDVAADAGADAVKFQTFDPKKLVSSAAPMAEYQEQNTGRKGSQEDLLTKLVLPHAAHSELQKHARERGLLFLSTPFDEDSADFLEGLDVPAFKVPSGELTNHPFIAHLARKGRPLLMSSGMATQLEVAQALEVVARNGAPPVALFHCVTNYPALPSDTNLAAMDTMRRCFGRPTGMSDHSEGLTIMLASVARGAELVEKHFTLDRTMEGPDHKASLEPGELKAMVSALREIEAARGDGVKAPRPAELPLIPIARKSLHAARALSAGELLTREDVVALRPGSGLSPARLEALLGQPLLRAVGPGQPLVDADFSPEGGR